MLKAVAVGMAMLAVLAGVTTAQVIPRRIEIDNLTCAELLATQNAARFRLLVYLNGYMNGLRGQKLWDEQVEGERIDQALSDCKAAPTRAALEVFSARWPR
jgi:HdeA/HdeB family